MFGIKISRQPKSIEHVKLQSNYNNRQRQYLHPREPSGPEEWSRYNTSVSTMNGSMYTLQDYDTERAASRQSMGDGYAYSRNSSRTGNYPQQQYMDERFYHENVHQSIHPNTPLDYSLQQGHGWSRPQSRQNNSVYHEAPVFFVPEHREHVFDGHEYSSHAKSSRASRARSRTFGGGPSPQGNDEIRNYDDDVDYRVSRHAMESHREGQARSLTRGDEWQERKSLSLPRDAHEYDPEGRPPLARRRNKSVVDFRNFVFGKSKATMDDDDDEETTVSKKSLFRKSEDVPRVMSTQPTSTAKRSFDLSRLVPVVRTSSPSVAAMTDVEDNNEEVEIVDSSKRGTRKLKHKLKKWLKKPISHFKRLSLQEPLSQNAVSAISRPSMLQKETTQSTFVNQETLTRQDSTLRQRLQQDFGSDDEVELNDHGSQIQTGDNKHQQSQESFSVANYMYNSSQMTMDSREAHRSKNYGNVSHETLESQDNMELKRSSALLEPVPFARPRSEQVDNDDLLDDYYGEQGAVDVNATSKQLQQQASSAAIQHLDSLLDEIDAELRFYNR